MITLGCNLSKRDALRFEGMAHKQGLSKTGLVQEIVLRYLENGGEARSATFDEAELEESQALIAELQQKLVQEKGKTIEDYSQEERARYFLGWLRNLSPENKAVLAEKYLATETKVAAAEKHEEPEVKEPQTEEAEFEVEELGRYRYRVYGQSAGLKEPEQISWDLFSGKEKWIDLAAPLEKETEDES